LLPNETKKNNPTGQNDQDGEDKKAVKHTMATDAAGK
jgi:hypothetical protein